MRGQKTDPADLSRVAGQRLYVFFEEPIEFRFVDGEYTHAIPLTSEKTRLLISSRKAVRNAALAYSCFCSASGRSNNYFPAVEVAKNKRPALSETKAGTFVVTGDLSKRQVATIKQWYDTLEGVFPGVRWRFGLLQQTQPSNGSLTLCQE